MNVKTKIFQHRKGRKGAPLEGVYNELAEIFYACALELALTAYRGINRAYPLEQRQKYEKLNAQYNVAHGEVKQLLNRYKNIVREDIIPLAIIKKHNAPYVETPENDPATAQLRALIDGQFITFYHKLEHNADLLVGMEAAEELLHSLSQTFAYERQKLLDNLGYFEASPRYSPKDWGLE